MNYLSEVDTDVEEERLATIQGDDDSSSVSTVGDVEVVGAERKLTS